MNFEKLPNQVIYKSPENKIAEALLNYSVLSCYQRLNDGNNAVIGKINLNFTG